MAVTYDDPGALASPRAVAAIWAAAGGPGAPLEVCRLRLLDRLAVPGPRVDWAAVSDLVDDALVEAGLAVSELVEEPPQEEFRLHWKVGPATASPDMETPAPEPQPAPPPLRVDWSAIETPAAEPEAAAEEVVLIEDDAPEGFPAQPEPEPAVVDWEALLDRVEAGEILADVAAEAGVSPKALGCRLGNRRRRAAAEAPAPAAVEDASAAAGGQDAGRRTERPGDLPEASSAPALSEAADTPAAAPAQDILAQGDSDEDDFWTPEMDLLLVQLMLKGKNSYIASQRFDCAPADCVNRFKVLLPVRGAAEEAALLAHLRAEVDKQ